MSDTFLQETQRESLTERDSRAIWHPFTQMQTALPSIAITHGKGLYIWDDTGKSYMDAISSWWVNLHGHAHPLLAQALLSQAETLEHVIFAGFTHKPAVLLAENLLEVLPRNQARIFYSDNGSTAVEVALKMAFQYWANLNNPRKKVLALKDSYHGDTFGSMAVSSPSMFTAPYRDLLFDVDFVDIASENTDNKAFSDLLHQEQYAAFIFEPLIQGSGGMKMHTPARIDAMIALAQEHGVLTIADEVMTGFGRTGKNFAVDYLENKPDIMCLSKGLTGGTMAMGVTSCTAPVYEAFLSTDRSKTFFHGHSYTANPLACAVAVSSLEILLNPDTQQSIAMITAMHYEFVKSICKHPNLYDARVQGTILALEWKTAAASSYFNSVRDTLYLFFLSEGILLRPLGNVLYMMPPYCITARELTYIYSKILVALDIIK